MKILRTEIFGSQKLKVRFRSKVEESSEGKGIVLPCHRVSLDIVFHIFVHVSDCASAEVSDMFGVHETVVFETEGVLRWNAKALDRVKTVRADMFRRVGQSQHDFIPASFGEHIDQSFESQLRGLF